MWPDRSHCSSLHCRYNCVRTLVLVSYTRSCDSFIDSSYFPHILSSTARRLLTYRI
ncbi:hypothetical protein JB92DRAFT_2885019 [Gautieria morchelliformis]|nr:hypothetical protein JB92DRAFT_2885019 [Gautieria morchelliformis]